VLAKKGFKTQYVVSFTVGLISWSWGTLQKR